MVWQIQSQMRLRCIYTRGVKIGAFMTIRYDIDFFRQRFDYLRNFRIPHDTIRYSIFFTLYLNIISIISIKKSKKFIIYLLLRIQKERNREKERNSIIYKRYCLLCRSSMAISLFTVKIKINKKSYIYIYIYFLIINTLSNESIHWIVGCIIDWSIQIDVYLHLAF